MPKEDPALPPDPALLNRQHNWFKRVLCVVFVPSILFILTAPTTIRARKKTDEVEATSNARQIGLALREFDTDYGAFPSAATQLQVSQNFPESIIKGEPTHSNGFFKQLFEAGLTQSEAMFYAKVVGARKPDGDISTNERALEKGEVGFAYIAGLTSEDDPNTPIVLAPIIPLTTKFDPEGFEGGGKAVVLHIDGSARTYKIAKDGRIYDKGIDLLSPKHPIWKGKKPDIRYPE
jgi:hypothetical protein